MKIQPNNDNTNFKQLKGIRLTGDYCKNIEARNVDNVVNSIRSNKIFQDIFSKRDGYIVLDKQFETYNEYAANSSNVIKNSLSIYFDLKLDFLSRLFSAGRPPILFKLIETEDYRCAWENKDFDGNIENKFNNAIRNYSEAQFDDFTNSYRRDRKDLIEDNSEYTSPNTNYHHETTNTTEKSSYAYEANMRRTYKAYLRGDCQNTAPMSWAEENCESNFNPNFVTNSLNSHTEKRNVYQEPLFYIRKDGKPFYIDPQFYTHRLIEYLEDRDNKRIKTLTELKNENVNLDKIEPLHHVGEDGKTYMNSNYFDNNIETPSNIESHTEHMNPLSNTGESSKPHVNPDNVNNNTTNYSNIETHTNPVNTNKNNNKKGFAKVAGMKELKEILQEDVILPLKNVELYKKYGIDPTNGMLLFGPPGTGKTFIAEALAEESGRTFLRMDIDKVESKYVGDTPKNIAKIFEEAKEKAPSIIFIDELEALTPSRSNLDGESSASVGLNQSVNTLLQNMNNCGEKGIFVIAASNEPQKIDVALLRAGRIDKNIFVAPPDFEARKELFKTYLENVYVDTNLNYDKMAHLTENYTAPEIKHVILRQAALKALKQNRRISESDIIEEIKTHKPQLDKEKIIEYKTKIKNYIHKINVDKQEEPNNNIKPLETFFNTTHESLENWLFESLQDINIDESFDKKQILAKLDEYNAQKGNVKEITNLARSFSFSRPIETLGNKSAYELMIEDKNISDFIKRNIKITTEDYLKAINKYYSTD